MTWDWLVTWQLIVDCLSFEEVFSVVQNCSSWAWLPKLDCPSWIAKVWLPKFNWQSYSSLAWSLTFYWWSSEEILSSCLFLFDCQGDFRANRMLKQNREEVHFSVGQSCSSLAWLLTAGTVRNYSHFDCQGDFRANTMLQQKKRGSTFLSRPGLLKLNLIAAACFYFHLFFCHHKFFLVIPLPFSFQRECSSGPLRKHTSFSESSSWAWLPHFHLFSHSHLHFQRECNSGPYGQSSSRAWLPHFHLLVAFDKIGVGDPENAVTKQATRNWPWWANAKKEIGSPILNCHQYWNCHQHRNCHQYWIVTNIELSPVAKIGHQCFHRIFIGGRRRAEWKRSRSSEK